MVAQWKKMLQNKPAFIQSIFGKNYGHLELSFYLKTLWKQDTAPKHFEPFETWNEIHLNQPQTSALWLCASEPHVPLSLQRNTHLDSAVQLQDPLQAEKKSTKCPFSSCWIQKTPVNTVQRHLQKSWEKCFPQLQNIFFNILESPLNCCNHFIYLGFKK